MEVVAIKEANILWIKNLLSDTDYPNIYISSEYGENMGNPAIILSIRKRTPIIVGAAALSSYNIITETMVMDNFYDYLISLRIHADIDEECTSIAEILQNKMLEAKDLPILNEGEVNISRVFPEIMINPPVQVENKFVKNWAVDYFYEERIVKRIIKTGDYDDKNLKSYWNV